MSDELSDFDHWKATYTVSDEYICASCGSSVREYDDNEEGDAFKCFECATIGHAIEGMIRTKLDGLLRI
jgi:DNA-directed RNA polymerase subunit RPC12/RpoP